MEIVGCYTLDDGNYEVKYNKEQMQAQYRHLKDETKCELTEHRYGEITGRYVIYRGEAMEADGVQYLNGEEPSFETALNAVAGNIFPVCGRSHHVQKRGLTDLPTIFCVLIDNTD